MFVILEIDNLNCVKNECKISENLQLVFGTVLFTSEADTSASLTYPALRW